MNFSDKVENENGSSAETLLDAHRVENLRLRLIVFHLSLIFATSTQLAPAAGIEPRVLDFQPQ